MDMFAIKTPKIITLNTNSRTFNMPQGYTIALAGDKNSQILQFDLPLEYDGIDFLGTEISIIYQNNWLKSDLSKSPKGTILPEYSNTLNGAPAIYYEHTDKNGKNHLYCKWLLNQNQLANAGYCNFQFRFKLYDENTSQCIFQWSSLPGSFIVSETEY